MPKIDLSMLNQRQTPAFYADVLANRPAAGFIGRIFVSTNTYAFYRDNGTSWDLIGGPGTGTITGSGSFGSIALWNGTNTITYDVGLTWDGTDNSLTASKFIVTGGTSSQFLKANGSLDSNTYNTGSGAVNQIAYWNGTNAITGDNELYYDSTNNYFGIGTNTPGAAIDAHSAVNVIQQLNQTVATNNSLLAFQNAGAGLWRIGNFYNSGANDYGVYDVIGAAQPFTIKKTTGQVLIGTSTVGSGKLVVASATGDNGVQIVGASAPSLRIDNAESGPTKRAGFGISTGVNNFIQGSADRDFCMFNGSTTASPILFGIYDAGAGNVQEAARISAGRNFLIGTTIDSGYKLQINGDAIINKSSGTPLFYLNTGSVNAASAIFIQSSGVNKWAFGTNLGTGDDAWSIYNFSASARYLTIASTGAATFSGVVTSNSYFAIDTTSSSYSIQGTFGWNNLRGTTITGKTASIYDLALYSASGGSLLVNPTATNTLAFIGGGNFLIGTTTDNGKKLQVNGDINQIGLANYSTNGLVVGSTYVNIIGTNSRSIYFASWYNTVGGAQGSAVFQATATLGITMISNADGSGTGVSFQYLGGIIQAKTTAGFVDMVITSIGTQ